MPEMICYQDYHIIHASFSFIFTIIFICFVTFILQTLYESNMSNTSHNGKTNSVFDQMIFLNKVCLSLSFSFIGFESNQWLLIALICIFSWLLFYYYFSSIHYLDHFIHAINSIFVTIFAWASLVLVIGKLFQKTSFDGALPLFFLGIPIIIIIILMKDINGENILKKTMITFNNGEEALNHIKILLYLSKDRTKSRRAKILLNGYVCQYELTCPIAQCPLKRYLDLSNNTIDLYPYLLQHIEILFARGISSFPNCISLRIAFSYYLLEYMNKKKQAQTELETCTYFPLSLEQQFNIYRTKKLIEEYKTNFHDNEDTIDAVVNNSYKSSSDAFKNIIKTITLLYIDFWSLLLMENEDQDHLGKLNEFGSKIISLLGDLQHLFNKIQKIKPNDQEVLYYYSDFLINVLNDKEKALSYKCKLRGFGDNNRNIIDDVNYFNLDIDALSSTDECQYIVISGQSEILGYITHISLGLCLILGYSKAELIGKSTEIIMPELYHKMHRKILIDKVNKYRKDYAVDSYTNNTFQPSFKQVTTFARNKARYLINITFNTTLIATETQGILFIAKLNPEVLNSSLFLTSSCYIMTNNSFLIQNFSVNSLTTLGMTSYVNNAAFDITSFIMEFAQEFLLVATEREDDLTNKEKIAIKRQIAHKRYKTPMSINWKMNDLLFDQRFKSSHSNDLESNSNTLITKKTLSQETFLLSIQDIIIGGKQEGYVFKFDPSNAAQFIGASTRISTKDIGIRRKISEKKILITKDVNELQHDQYKSFIPEGKAIFILDPNKMSYLVNNKNNQTFKEEIRNKALQKININPKPKNDDSSSYDNEEEDNDSSIDSSEQTSEMNSIENSTPNLILKNETKHSNNSNHKQYRTKTIMDDNEYYKVNLANIKYSIYSFEKKTDLEVEGYIKKSQVIIKMSDEEEKEKELTNPSIKRSFKTPDGLKDNEKDSIEQDDILIKQIEYALSKEDKHQSIINLKLAMLGILIICLLFEALWLYFLIDTKNTLDESFNLLSNTYKLLFNFLISHAAIRDLSLISNQNYTHSKTMSKEESITLILKGLSLLYDDSQLLIHELLTTHITLNSNHSFLFYNETIEITVIQNSLDVHKYNITLIPALTEANNAIFHIITDNNHYIPTDAYIFFYLSNLNNDLCLKIQSQAVVFIYQFFEMIKFKKMNFYYLLIINALITISLYFLFAFVYEVVAKKKESYLKVFFNIGGSVIRASLEKCEYFLEKLQPQTFLEFQSCNFDNENDDLIRNKVVKKKNEKQKNNKTNKASKETMMIKGLFCVFLIIINIYSCLGAILYALFLDQLVIYMRIFLSQNGIFTEFGHLYRNTREFFFDDYILIENISVDIFYPTYLNNFYSVLTKKQLSTIEFIRHYTPEYLAIYNKIYYQDICVDELLKDELCLDVIILELSEYGLSAILPFFVEEIRFLKNTKTLHRMISDEKDFKYNLTLTGLDQYSDLYPKDPNDNKVYFEGSPILFFNNRIYKRIKGIFDLIIVPSFLLLFDELRKSIESYISSNALFFNGLSAVSFAIVLAIYLCLWKPFETKLHSIIFKTKNMLAIIPKEVLASLENINKLLNLNQSFTKASYASKK